MTPVRYRHDGARGRRPETFVFDRSLLRVVYRARLAQRGVGRQARVMESDRFAATWHEAADRANYDFYEPDSDQYRSAGNYSGDGNQIGVCGLVDEHTVHVETWVERASARRRHHPATIGATGLGSQPNL